MASIYKRNGRWRVQVRRGEVSRSADFGSKQAADRWARATEHELDMARSTGNPAQTTLTAVLHRYRAELRGEMKSTKRSILGLLKQRLGALQVTQLSSAQVYEYVRKREREGAGPATLNQELMYLKSTLRVGGAFLGVDVVRAIEAVTIARAALSHAKRIGESNRRDRRPTEDELKRILHFLYTRPRSSVPMVDMVHIARCTALRAGEIVKLEWGDIEEASRVVMVRDRKDPQNPRSGRIPLLQGVVTWEGKMLDPLGILLRQRRVDRRIFPYSGQTITNWWITACRETNIEGLTFHDLRHDAISMLFEAGYHVEQVALVSGHKTWKHLQRYTHIKPESLHRS